MRPGGRPLLGRVRSRLARDWAHRDELAKSALAKVHMELRQHDPHGYEVPAEFMRTGYLSEVGWYRTVAEQRVVDLAGKAIPWLVYPMIRLLDDRCRARELTVFEYGAGSSTLWWADRAGKVVSVEHDLSWYESLSGQVPPHVGLRLIPLDSSPAYERAVLDADGPFDVIVIDGRRRSECGAHAPSQLSQRGVILWDNSDRARYADAIRKVEKRGFKRLELHGLAPRDNISSASSVLYRPGNLLGL